MNDNEIKKIVSDSSTYDEARENTLRSMLGDFYNRKMTTIVLFVWAWAIALIAAAIYCAVRYFQSDLAKDLIFFATAFLCCMLWMNLIKTFAWQMIHRNSIKREIKRLELRIAELTEAIGSK